MRVNPKTIYELIEIIDRTIRPNSKDHCLNATFPREELARFGMLSKGQKLPLGDGRSVTLTKINQDGSGNVTYSTPMDLTEVQNLKGKRRFATPVFGDDGELSHLHDYGAGFYSVGEYLFTRQGAYRVTGVQENLFGGQYDISLEPARDLGYQADEEGAGRAIRHLIEEARSSKGDEGVIRVPSETLHSLIGKLQPEKPFDLGDISGVLLGTGGGLGKPHHSIIRYSCQEVKDVTR